MCKYPDGKGITGSAPLSKEERQKQIDSLYGKGAFQILKCTDYKSPVKLKHKCGKIIEPKRLSIVISKAQGKGVKCPCEHIRPLKITAQIHAKAIKAKHGNKFKLVKFVGAGMSYNTYKHTECGKTFKRSYESFKLTKHCPHCVGKFGGELAKVTTDDITKRLKKKFKGQYVIIGKTNGISKPITLQHKCGFKFKKKPDELLRCVNPICEGCGLGNKIANHKTITIDGIKFVVQGFEPRLLKKLAKKYGAENVICGKNNVRRFYYRFKGKQSSYYPDFMIKGTKLVYEVKSLATLGLLPDRYCFFGEDVFERNQAKAKAVERQGFKFRLRLYRDKVSKLKVPANWHALTKQLLAANIGVTIN